MSETSHGGEEPGTLDLGFLLPEQRPLRGRLMLGAAFLWVLSSAGLAAAATSLTLQTSRPALGLFGAIWIPLSWPALILAHRGYRHLTRSYRNVFLSPALQSDQRRPVLYLRAFSDDGRRAAMPLRLDYNPLDPGARRAMLLMLRFCYSFEQALAIAFRRIGRIVAIGRPTSELPELGAVREYVAGGAWKDRVSELLARSQLVIMQIGASEGLIWEVEHVARNVEPRKLVLAIPLLKARRFWPFGKERDRLLLWAAFRKEAASFFPRSLPKEVGRERSSSGCQFIRFEDDWTPVPIFRPRPRVFDTFGAESVEPLDWLTSALVKPTLSERVKQFGYSLLYLLQAVWVMGTVGFVALLWGLRAGGVPLVSAVLAGCAWLGLLWVVLEIRRRDI